jgi:zinc protease
MANYMMGGSIAARWPDRIRNREGLSYDAGSGFSAPAFGDAALFQAAITSNPQLSPKVEASLRDELRKTLADGFTQKELDAAKIALHDERVLGRSSDTAILGLIAARTEQDRTLDWDIQMDPKLAALTLDQVNAAFRKHVTNDMSIVQAGDFAKAGVYR